MDMSELKHLRRAGTPMSAAVADATRRLIRARTQDQQYTYDAATIDSTGAFLVGQLERLDPTLNEPLVEYTWSRDVYIRTDVSAADEVASFTNSAFGMNGGINPNGLNWISNEGNALAGPSVDIGKTPQPLRLWGAEVKYTVPELVKSQKLGMPIDSQKVEGMNLKRNMDVDQIVYYGDPQLGFTGLVNSTGAVGSVTNVANGAAGTPQWNTKTPNEILADVNEILTAAWQASGWKVKPNRLMLPPAKLGYIASQMISSAGNKSILTYILENNICTQQGVPLEVLELKWLIGAGVGGTQGQLGTVDRMVAYNSDKKYVQFPMTDLQRTPLEYRSLFQITTYWSRIGQIEWRYGVTAAYRDGL
ncbi:putative bacteriophage protein [Burkholderia multivorans]